MLAAGIKHLVLVSLVVRSDVYRAVSTSGWWRLQTFILSV